MTKTVQVDITSDLICPWCWVGLRKLQEASRLVAASDDIQTRITWHPYMLRPNTPLEGQLKTGIPASRVGNHLRTAGQSVGIDFTGLTDRTPNTNLFHATLHDLQHNYSDSLTNRQVTAFHEAVFEAYFTLGIFPDQQGLLRAAKSMTDAETSQKVVAAMTDLYDNPTKVHELQDVVLQEAIQASFRGNVNGVPTFAFNGCTAFSGAQAVPAFVEALQRAAASTT